MRETGVDRLVTVTGAGVRDADDRPKLVDKVFVIALRRLQGDLLADSEAMVAALRRSDVQWTVVRVPRLTDQTPRGTYRVARNVGPTTGTRLARGDLARFVLDEVEQNAYVGALPVVSA